MQAVSVLAPAFAPLALKLIDKYIFDEPKARRPVRRVIKVSATPRYVCCCGQLIVESDSETEYCSTCYATKSSDYESSKLCLPIRSSSGRTSSTSDAYERETTKSSYGLRGRIRSDSDTQSTTKYSNNAYHLQSTYAMNNNNNDTLSVLANQLEKKISPRNCRVTSHARPLINPGSSERRDKASSRVRTDKYGGVTSSSRNARKSCGKSIVGSKYDGSSWKYDCDSDAYQMMKR